MRTTTVFSLAILLAGCAGQKAGVAPTSQPQPTKAKPAGPSAATNHAEMIASVKGNYKAVNSELRSYRRVKKSLAGETTEGGGLDGYFKGDVLMKMVASYYGEMGKRIEEYYFLGGELSFTFVRSYSYDKPITIDGFKVNKIDERRYYFHKEKLIRWLGPNKEKISESKFPQKEREILLRVKKLKTKRSRGS